MGRTEGSVRAERGLSSGNLGARANRLSSDLLMLESEAVSGTGLGMERLGSSEAAASDLGEVHVTQLLLLKLAGHDLLVNDGLEVLGVAVAPVLLPPDCPQLAPEHEAGLPGGFEFVFVHVICGQTFFDFVELLQDLLFFHIQLLERN